MYTSVVVDMYATLLVDVICMRGINDHTLLGESGKLFLVIGYKIGVGNRWSIILFLRDVINKRGVGGECVYMICIQYTCTGIQEWQFPAEKSGLYVHR